MSYIFVMLWLILAFIHELFISWLPCYRRYHYSKALNLSNEILNQLDQVAKIGDYFFLTEMKRNCHKKIFKGFMSLFIEHRTTEKKEKCSKLKKGQHSKYPKKIWLEDLDLCEKGGSQKSLLS